jgi:hypothetical protein
VPRVEATAPTPKAKPRIGYILAIIGGALTLLSGIGYLVLGNPVAGVLGVVFGVLIVIYSRRLYAAVDIRKVGIYGAIPFFLGWVVLIASGTLLPFDLVVSLAGFLTVVGSVGLFAGR